MGPQHSSFWDRFVDGFVKGLQNLWAILSVPDNIPIVFMLCLVIYFTWLSFTEARKNDRLIQEGRKDQVLRRMQD